MISVSEKIKHIELLTKRLMHINLLGNARSVVKGSGLDFDQLRDYQMGDDVRSLDWNSSARMNKLLVKQFNDERHRTLIIALDISASCFYGSQTALKKDVLAQIAAIISYAGYIAKDEVGIVFFSDTVEEYIPPRKGRAHIQRILEKIFSMQKKETTTNLTAALDHIIALRKKNAMVFLISDFITDTVEQKLSLCAHVSDVVAIRVLDTYEHGLPSLGLITVRDSETQQMHVIDSRSGDLADILKERLVRQTKFFTSNRVAVLDINGHEQVVEQLIHFFKIRNKNS